jgi:hypothetical protein
VKQRTVDEIGQNFGTTDASIPHLFLLDRPLKLGDSGALVRLLGGGSALGLYMGELATSTGPRGLCQGLHQLDALLTHDGFSRGFYEE